MSRPGWTLAEAAAHAGVSKATIRKAQASGRLTGWKDERSRWLVDPADVLRLWPGRAAAHAEPGTRTPAEVRARTQDTVRAGARTGARALEARCAAAEARVELLERMVEDARSEREAARAREDRLVELMERRVAGLERRLLEPPDHPKPDQGQPWWRRLFRT